METKLMIVFIAITLLFSPQDAQARFVGRHKDSSRYTIVVLTSGTSWTVPSDWNSSDNTIQCVGGGGRTSSSDGGGGGGGGGSGETGTAAAGAQGMCVISYLPL